MSKLEKIGPATYRMAPEGGMRVPGLLIANEAILNEIEIEKPLEQLRNVATLPGIVGYSIAMPDIHWGYGFPIGGVAAMDLEEGVISPGGVGYDINCGVRLAIAPIPFRDLSQERKRQLIRAIFKKVPSGVGFGHKERPGLTYHDYKALIEQGARWSIEQGYGFTEDLIHMESGGVIDGGDVDATSPHARERGAQQLGSIGSGNHFVEIGEVERPLLPEVASKWGVEEGQTYLLIHSGSRGFGHQVCQDNLERFFREGYGEGLPDRQLVAAPIRSPSGQAYFAAMAAAANFAFNNRQQILHGVREAFEEVCSTAQNSIHLIYDVCHNIAKIERHLVNGSEKSLCVHRKGATRAFEGQPVLVPGDMGRASYLMEGRGSAITWGSACHGAGRACSRVRSAKRWAGVDLIANMRGRGVEVEAHSHRTIAEEMPEAYKDVDIVVEAVEEAGLATRVVRLRPKLVVKG